MTVTTFQLIGILLGIAATLFIVWILKSQHDIKRAVVGHIYPTFYTSTGSSYQELCATDDVVVHAPVRAQQALDKATKGKVKDYFIREDKSYNMLYPPGKPSWLQTTVPTTAYYEGNPDPIVSRDPKNRMEPIGTPAVIHNIRDEKMTGLMVRVGEEMERFRKAAQGIVNPKVVYLLLVILTIFGIINTFLAFNASSQVSRLASLWGL